MSDGGALARGWSVPPPPPAARIVWPESFGTRFIVTVDVEEEFDWSGPFDRNAPSVQAVTALPAAQRRLREGGAGIACMVDYPVADDPSAAEALREMLAANDASLGAQLHPWVNPPFDDAVDSSFVSNLPAALQKEKLTALTDKLTSALGRAPLAYRAGRYGIGPETAAMLAEAGYRIDTSMRARFDYRDAGGPDFGAIDSAPFRLGSILELPLSTIYTGALRRIGAPLHRAAGRIPHGRGALARSTLLMRVPLTPEGTSVREAGEAVRVALGEGARLLVLAFHSPSLVPGHTPYVRTMDDLRIFWGWWDAILSLLARHGAASTTFDEIVAAADR